MLFQFLYDNSGDAYLQVPNNVVLETPGWHVLSEIMVRLEVGRGIKSVGLQYALLETSALCDPGVLFDNAGEQGSRICAISRLQLLFKRVVEVVELSL